MLLHGLDQYGNVKTLSTDWGVEAGIASFMNHYRTAACFRKFAAALAGSNDGDVFYLVEDIDFSNAGGFIHMVSRDGEAATKSFGKKEVLVEAWCGRIRANDSRLSHVNALPFGSEKKLISSTDILVITRLPLGKTGHRFYWLISCRHMEILLAERVCLSR